MLEDKKCMSRRFVYSSESVPLQKKQEIKGIPESALSHAYKSSKNFLKYPVYYAIIPKN